MLLPTGLVGGVFGARLNRFAARVSVDGRDALAHVPNSGRMTELLTAGAQVLLAPAPAGSGRRTAFDLALVSYQGRWVGVDSRLPPSLVVEAWRSGLLERLAGFDTVRREVRLGASRLDLLFQGPEGECYVEAKSVNLVEDGVALFPDAPTTRGARHLDELATAVASGGQAAAVFVVQRNDAAVLVPYVSADPAFADSMRRASEAGVALCALACEVTPTAITPVRVLPVRLAPEVPTRQEGS